MKSELEKIEGELIGFHDLTEGLAQALRNGNFDEIIHKLNQRQRILQHFKKNKASLRELADNKSDKSSHKLELIMNSIIELDQKNMEVIDIKIKNLTSAVADLARERDAINNLRAAAKFGQKQLVDFLY